MQKENKETSDASEEFLKSGCQVQFNLQSFHKISCAIGKAGTDAGAAWKLTIHFSVEH